MKWAKLDGVEEKNRLLYTVLTWVIAPYDNRPVDHFLKRILGPKRGFGGDPGWEIEWMTGSGGDEHFKVWADKDSSCLDEEELNYDPNTFYSAVRETLLAYSHAHQHRAMEVTEIMQRYGIAPTEN